MRFVLDDETFEINEAVLTAHWNNPDWCDKCNRGDDKGFGWDIEVTASPRSIRGRLWIPTASINHLVFAVKDWRQIAGLEFDWPETYQPCNGVSPGFISVFGNDLMTTSHLRFLRMTDDRISIQWEGEIWNDEHTTYCPDEQPSKEVSFLIEADLSFTGVTVRGGVRDSVQVLREILAENLHVSDFVLTDFQQGTPCWRRELESSIGHYTVAKFEVL